MTSEELQESADLPQLAEKFKNNIQRILDTPPISFKLDKAGNLPEALKNLYIDYVTITSTFIKQIVQHQMEYTDTAPDQIKSDLKRNCIDLDNFMVYKSKNFMLIDEVQGMKYKLEQNDNYINQLLSEREKLHNQITGLYETIAQWEAKFNQQRNECVQQIVQNQQKQDDIRFLEKKLTALEGDNSNQIQELNDTIENLTKYNQKLQQQLKEIVAQSSQQTSGPCDIFSSSEYRQLQEKNNELSNQLSLLQQETSKQAKEDSYKMTQAQLELQQFKEQIAIANLNNRETILRQNAQIAEQEKQISEMKIIIADLSDDQALNTNAKVCRLRAEHSEEMLKIQQKLTNSEAEVAQLKKKQALARITMQELRQKLKFQERQLQIYMRDAPPDERLRLLEAQIEHQHKDLQYYKEQYRQLYFRALESGVFEIPQSQQLSGQQNSQINTFATSGSSLQLQGQNEQLYFSGDGYQQEAEQLPPPTADEDAPDAILGEQEALEAVEEAGQPPLPPASSRSYALAGVSVPESARSRALSGDLGVQVSTVPVTARLTKRQVEELVGSDEDLYLLKLSIEHKLRESYIPPPNAGRRVRKPSMQNSLRYAVQLHGAQQLSKSK